MQLRRLHKPCTADTLHPGHQRRGLHPCLQGWLQCGSLVARHRPVHEIQVEVLQAKLVERLPAVQWW